MNKKSILEILVLHQSFLEHKNSKEAYEVIREEAQKINEGETYKNLPKIRVDDWELSQPDSGSIQNLEKIKEDADNANAVFIIADGNISPDTKKWYESAIKESLNEASKRQVRIPVFWNISTAEYKKNFKEFCNSGSKHDYDKRDKLYPYDTLEIEPNANAPLRPQVASLLIQLANKWAAMINREETIPTLMSNRIRRNKRKKALIITAAFIIALGLLFYFLWPRIKDVRDKKAFGQRISNIEALISDKQYGAARDSLNILDSLCTPKWQDLKEQIKKLKESFPTTPSPDPEPIQEPKLNLQSTAHTHQIIKNGCVIISDNQDLESILRKNLGNADLSLVFPEKGIPEWKIEIRETVDSTIFTDEDVKFYRAQVTIFADIKKGNAIETLSAKKICNGQLSHTSSTNTAREKAADDISEQIVEYLKQHK